MNWKIAFVSRDASPDAVICSYTIEEAKDEVSARFVCQQRNKSESCGFWTYWKE